MIENRIYFNEDTHTLVKDGVKSKKPFEYDLEKFYSRIGGISYEPYRKKYNIKQDAVEFAKNIPTFIDSFHELYFMNSEVPEVEQMFDHYFSKGFQKHDDTNISYNGKIFNEDAFKSRLVRTYPSLVRDLQISMLFLNECHTNTKVSNVYYDTMLDKSGVDLSFFYKNIPFHARIRLDSKRSNEFNALKNKRHEYSCYNPVEFVVKFEYAIGDFFVLDQNMYDKLYELMEEKLVELNDEKKS